MIRATVLFALTLALTLSACSENPDVRTSTGAAPVATAAPIAGGGAGAGPSAGNSLPPMTVHKSPSCGCCGVWVEHMTTAGFAVTVVDAADLNPLKTAMGVPAAGGSCHTAIVGGYFVEGHVPAADIQRLLAERPAARGLTVPGMVVGSPGMEVPSGEVQPYTVYLVDLDGNTTPYSHHGQ